MVVQLTLITGGCCGCHNGEQHRGFFCVWGITMSMVYYQT